MERTHIAMPPVLETAELDEWAALMKKAQDGDRAAYHRLLTEITPFIRALSSRALKSRSDVEDTVQDVLLTVHEVRHTYDPMRPFQPWLATITRRRLIDRYRRSARRSAHEVEFHEHHETIADPTTNNEQEASLIIADLEKAFQQLPPGQRQAVELLKVQGMSLKEASFETGISVAALKVAAHRGYKALRAVLTGGGDDKTTR